jgi:hypothetical protein
MEALPTYEVLSRVLDGGWVEHVNVLWRGQEAALYVNELSDLLHLPVNPKATAIYHNATRHGRGLLTFDDPALPPHAFISHDLARLHGTAILWTGPTGATRPPRELDDAP